MKQMRSVIPLLLMLVFIVPAVHFKAPPRFDETGYCLLAKSLAEGHGYREIEKPNAPRHAHFPPGWPMALALVWKILPDTTAARVASAHMLTICCWLGSVSIWGLWLKRVAGRGVGPLFLAVAMNWLWIRLAGELRSESLFLLLAAIVVWRMTNDQAKNSGREAILLGLAVGLATLTRQVGVALAVAVVIEFWFRKETRAAVITVVVSLIVVLPWVFWQKFAGTANQAELLTQDELSRSLARRLTDQALFYACRLPDSLFGPYVETATVFTHKPAVAIAATVGGIVFCVILLIGLRGLFRRAETRPAALYFSVTMAILLVWPFTEAGRFLIPLVPVTLLAVWLGGVECLGMLARKQFKPGSEMWIAWCICLLAVPFGLYTWQKNARTSPAGLDRDFDSATAWMAGHLPKNAVIAARHPGDVYWRTGLKAVGWPEAGVDLEKSANAITDSGGSYLLVDQGRFVGASVPAGLSEESLTLRPDRFERVEMPSVASSKTRLWRIVPAAK